MTSVTVTREQAVREAGEVLAEAYRLLVELPVEEAARRAYTPTGPSLAELKARIRARRPGDGSAVA